MPVYAPEYSGQFKRDVKLAQKRGYDMDKLKTLAVLLLSGEPLPSQYKDHALSGNWKGCQDAHIAPDWLLIYRYVDDVILRFERTGTHADLFS